MKKIINLFLILMPVFGSITAQNISINTSGTVPNISAILDISSTEKGVLIPRMTDVERQALKDPIAGLLIYNTTSTSFNYYNGSGWNNVVDNNISTTSGTGTATTRGIAINITGDDADQSSILDISSSEKGMLIPRTTQASVTPVEGLIIYNTSTNTIDYFDGVAWRTICNSTLDNIFGMGATSQGIAINDGGASPHPSAILDVSSNTSGLLISRMTSTERDAIKSPATGLLLYNLTTARLESWDGTTWNEIRITSVGCSAPIHCGGVPTQIVDVVSAGETWMDRNLGAAQVATSSTDAAAFGDLYQWGRFSDGHQCRTGGIWNASNATTEVPNQGNNWDGLFITESVFPFDWLVPSHNSLWQGVSGTNNPCPSGYRLPTEVETTAERLSWISNDAAGAFASPLKLTLGGSRYNVDGTINLIGTSGYIWVSTSTGTGASELNFGASGAGGNTNTARAYGYSVRCIKN